MTQKHLNPVTIDPTTVYTGPHPDCTLQAGAPTTSSCLAATDQIAGGTSPAHMLLYFYAQEAVPADSDILMARVHMYLSSWANSTTTPVGMYALTKPFTTAATWNTSDGSAAWGTPGGDYSSTSLDTENVTASAGWDVWYPTSAVRGWVDGSQPNDGLIVKEPSDNVANQLTFLGGGDPGGNGPFLEIYYDARGGEPRGATIVSQQLNDRMSVGVNVANGNLLIDANDLDIKGTGQDLIVHRTYNNLIDNPAWTGNGWRTTQGFDDHLEFLDDGSIVFHDGTGMEFPFDTNHGGAWVTPPGIDGTLTQNSDSSYTLAYQNGTQENFTQWGTPASRVDANGNTITYSYSGSVGQNETLTDTQGRQIAGTGQASSPYFLSQLTDPTGRTLKYGYNAADTDLTSFTDGAGKVTSYGYDSGDNLTQITDPNGNVIKLAYDSGRRITSIIRVTNTSAGTGPTWTYTYYSPANAPVACGTAPAGMVAYGETIQTDPNNNQTAYCYDTHDRVYASVDPAGKRTVIAQNTDDLPITETQPNGGTTSSTFDTCERDTQDQAPTTVQGTTPVSDTSSYSSQCTGPATYEPSSSRDALGNTTSYSYDSYGNPTSITDALSAAGPYQNTTQDHITLTYSSSHQGWLTQSTDPDGHVTTYGYDTQGNLTSITPPSPLGQETFGYDGLSRQTSYTDGKSQTTTTTYDALDRVSKTAYADGTTVTSTYDANGNLLTQTDPSGTETNVYNALNQLTKTTLPNGHVITYTYDQNGNLASLTDGGGTVSYTYNNLNQLTKITQPDSSLITFAYDADGNRTGISYPNGVSVAYTYDAADRPLTMTAKNSSGTVLASQTNTYTLGSKDTELLQTQTDQSGNTTTYTYDPLDRLVEAKTISSGGSTVSDYKYSYDGGGNRLTQIKNGATTTYTYNGANELTAVNSAALSYDANGNETNNGTSTLSYNARNQTTGLGSGVMTFFGNGQKQETSASSSGLQADALGLGAIVVSGTTTYLTRDSSGTPLAERASTGNSYLITGTDGTVLAVADASGNKARTNVYDPYGALLSATGTGPDDLGYLGTYAGQPGGLEHFGDRMLDTSTGRWTQTDPDRQVSDPTQSDAYVYSGDDPVNASDATGDNWYFTFTKSAARYYGRRLTYGGDIAKILARFIPNAAASELADLAAGMVTDIGKQLYACGLAVRNGGAQSLCGISVHTFKGFGDDSCVPDGNFAEYRDHFPAKAECGSYYIH